MCVASFGARADSQVKADNCSSASSGTMIGSSVTIDCLSKEDIARVIDELVHQGVVRRAEDVGIEHFVIVSLAARLKPTQKLGFAQAVVEVSHAIDIAVKIVEEGSRTSSDQLVDEVQKRIAERTKANDPAGATRAAEQGFAEWSGKRRSIAPRRWLRGSPCLNWPCRRICCASTWLALRRGWRRSSRCSMRTIRRRCLPLRAPAGAILCGGARQGRQFFA